MVSGVSGSGKSTLVNMILKRALAQKLNNNSTKPGKISQSRVTRILKKLSISIKALLVEHHVVILQLILVFLMISEPYLLKLMKAKLRGYTKARFSFNVKGGRCEACHGDGIIKIEMNFLPDVYVPCEVCHGTRYNSETLEVTYRGKNIAQVLDMTINEATKFFENIPKISA